MSILAREYFHNEKAAFAKLEAIVWHNGPVCPHCGNDKKKIYELKTRLGVKKCGACRKQFTVRVGTVFESSHVPLHKWLQASYLMCSSKKGISSHQLHRILEVTYKTAWFMTHRIRKAMERGTLVPTMGGSGGTIEMDETYIGTSKKPRPAQRGHAHKMKVISLVDRSGEARSFQVDAVNANGINKIAAENVKRETTIYTDEGSYYTDLKKSDDFHHGAVTHSHFEWKRGDIHTNTVEGYFSIFKRGMKGVYQHCSEKHLHRYLSEFDFRYSNRIKLGVNDEARTEKVLRGVKGKRLYYRQPV